MDTKGQKLTYLQHKRMWFDTFYMYSQVCVVQKHLARRPGSHGGLGGRSSVDATMAMWGELRYPSWRWPLIWENGWRGTLPETHQNAPKNRPKSGNKRKGSSSNHPFLGTLLVSGRVYSQKLTARPSKMMVGRWTFLFKTVTFSGDMVNFWICVDQKWRGCNVGGTSRFLLTPFFLVEVKYLCFWMLLMGKNSSPQQMLTPSKRMLFVFNQ